MIDPRLLRDDPDLIRAAQAKRGLSASVVDAALEADAARRTAIADFEQLRAEQKQLGKLIAKAQGDERADLLARTKTLAADVKGAELASPEEIARNPRARSATLRTARRTDAAPWGDES